MTAFLQPPRVTGMMDAASKVATLHISSVTGEEEQLATLTFLLNFNYRFGMLAVLGLQLVC